MGSGLSSPQEVLHVCRQPSWSEILDEVEADRLAGVQISVSRFTSRRPLRREDLPVPVVDGVVGDVAMR
jgi:hypothetical protein